MRWLFFSARPPMRSWLSSMEGLREMRRGEGGSMHLYADRLLGGLAIVGGHVPIATGAAFSIKYLKKKGWASFCFLRGWSGGSRGGSRIAESRMLFGIFPVFMSLKTTNGAWGQRSTGLSASSRSRKILPKPMG